MLLSLVDALSSLICSKITQLASIPGLEDVAENAKESNNAASVPPAAAADEQRKSEGASDNVSASAPQQEAMEEPTPLVAENVVTVRKDPR